MSTKKLSFFNKIANKIKEGIKGFFSKNDEIKLVSYKKIDPSVLLDDHFDEDKLKKEYKKVNGLKIELNVAMLNVFKNNIPTKNEKLDSLKELDQAISKELASLVDAGLKESLKSAKDLISEVTKDIKKGRKSISPELKNELNNVNSKLRNAMNKHSKKFLSAEEANMITSVYNKVDLCTHSFFDQSIATDFKKSVEDYNLQLKTIKEESNIKEQKDAKFMETQIDVAITTTMGTMKTISNNIHKKEENEPSSNIKPNETPNQLKSKSTWYSP
jgi:hypothetical protein